MNTRQRGNHAIQPKIRLIALDLDGTLMNQKKEITPRTRAVIREAAQAGILVMPATGRPVTGFPDVLAAMPNCRYALTSNGALVYDLQEKRAVYEDMLSLAHTLAVLDFLKDRDVMVDVYQDGNGYSDRQKLADLDHYTIAKGMREYILRTRIPVDSVRDFVTAKGRPVEKLVIFFHDVGEKPEVERSLSALPFLRTTDASPVNLEVNHSTANKGDSLLRFGAQLGIAREEIMAVGDGRNDRDMIIAAGLGVAMANACDELKEAADVETLSNDEDGVAAAIEKYALGR